MSKIVELFPQEVIEGARSGGTWWQIDVKRKLKQQFAPEEAFELFRKLMSYPASAKLKLLPICSFKETALRKAKVFCPIEAGGERFALHPPLVIGDGNHRVLNGVARSMYVAALEGVSLRGRSQLVVCDDTLLLDYEGAE